MQPNPTIIVPESPASRPLTTAEGDHRSPCEPTISVEITTAERFTTIGREWRDLTSRALEQNVFMEPSVVAAAAAAEGAAVHVLLAWGSAGQGTPIRLVGAWAFARRRPSSRLPLAVLKAPVNDHASLGIPVLDADLGAAALARMLDAITDDPGLPKLVEIANLDAAGPVALLVADVVAGRGSRLACLEKRLRPQLATADTERAATPLSSSRAKALRQRRKRLGGLGAVTCTMHTGEADIRSAIDEFLTLEAAGWKGMASRRGRAILRMPSLESFFRAAISGLAAQDLATVTALRCDGRPVAMQVTIRSGATAFTWKSTYDEAAKACAPGIILLQDVTAALLTDRRVSTVDSCNHRDDGYMAEFWNGRRAVQDVVLDAGRGRSLPFLVLRCAEQSRRRFQVEARRIRGASQSLHRRASAALRSLLATYGSAQQRRSAGVGPVEVALVKPTERDHAAPRGIAPQHRFRDGSAT